MVRWLIATPCWGERCVNVFIDHALPAIKAAIECQPGDYRFIIHTDRRDVLEPVLAGYDVEWVHVVGDSPYATFSIAHKDALRLATADERIAFINADIVVSRECFAASEIQFAAGKRAIATGCVRSLHRDNPPPVGAAARTLREWAIDNLHPVMEEFVWGTGRTALPSILLFRNNGSVVLRAFHIHPLAVIKDRDLAFSGHTIDADLLDRFQRSEIHVVGDPDEMAIAELSPEGRGVQMGQLLSPSIVAMWAKRKASPLHRWFFSHRLRLTGAGECGDAEPARQILRMLGVRP